MKRLVLVVLLVLAAPAQAACTENHRCHKTLKATSHLRQWVTPQQIARNASVEVRVWVRGKQVSYGVTDGGDAVFVGKGLVLVAAIRRERAPLTVTYAAKKKTRVRFVYWTD